MDVSQMNQVRKRVKRENENLLFCHWSCQYEIELLHLEGSHTSSSVNDRYRKREETNNEQIEN